MQTFVNVFLLSGVILGIVLNFSPELFSGVAVKSSLPPVPDLAASVAANVASAVGHSTESGLKELSSVLTKVVNIVINELPFTVSLDSIDKDTIIKTARKLCITHAAALKISPEEVDNGCVNAVAEYIFKDVFGGELSQYPVTIQIPIEHVGVFDLQFDMMKTTPRQVALSFCQGKQAELNIVSEEDLHNSCVPSVEKFIVDDLKKRGVLDVEQTAVAVESSQHIPFTAEEEAALKVAEEEIVHHHHEQHEHHDEPVASLQGDSEPPADVGVPVEANQI